MGKKEHTWLQSIKKAFGRDGRLRAMTRTAVEALQRRTVPVGFLALCVMAVAAAVLGVTIGVKRLSPAWAFNVGEDVVGIIICALLFCGCFGERQPDDDSMRLFAALLFCDALTQFFDLCSWLLEGIPALRMLNVIVYTLDLCCIIALAYQFWRYVRFYLALDGALLRDCDLAMRVFLAPALILCLSNAFVPLSFYVDEQGVYYETNLYLLSFAYLPVLAVCATICLLRSKIPLRNKMVLASFYIVPSIYAIFYVSSDGAVLPDAPLLSIILMYVVLVTDRSKTLVLTKAELNMAADIQANALPNLFPAFPDRKEFDIFATMDPAKEVGGDFYDFFKIGDDLLGIVVADVSGKGVPAALFMMVAKTMLKTQALTGLSPDRVLLEVNAALMENNKEDMFVTAWLGVLKISTGELTYADAGHEKLLLFQDGGWKYLPKKRGFALAALDPEDLELLGDSSLYQNQTVQLKPGDAIFQYTDGVTEATNAEAELFGDKRLLEAMNCAPSVDPEDLLPHIRRKIDEFVKDAEQFDDITMLGLRYNGSPE